MKLLPTRSFVLAGAVLIACLILVSNTFAADQSTLPKITGEGIQSLVAKNKGKVVCFISGQPGARPAQMNFRLS